jgi:hypothetical protein
MFSAYLLYIKYISVSLQIIVVNPLFNRYILICYIYKKYLYYLTNKIYTEVCRMKFLSLALLSTRELELHNLHRRKGKCSLTTTFQLDDVFVKNTVESLSDLLLEYYIFPKTAETIKTFLLDKLAEGDLFNVESGFDLSKKITGYMRDISNDIHLTLNFSEKPIPIQLHDSNADEDINLRQKLNNFGFEKVERYQEI